MDGRNEDSNSAKRDHKSRQKKPTLNIFCCFRCEKSGTNNVVKDDNVINYSESSSNLIRNSSNPTHVSNSLDNHPTTSQLNKKECLSRQSSYAKELEEEVLRSGR